MLFAQAIPFAPPVASAEAERAHVFFFFLCTVSALATVLVATLILTFAIRYRRRPDDGPTPRIHGSLRLELFWSIVPFLIFCVMFVWGADLYFDTARPPDDALQVYVVGKQWMWKVQHVSGVREINELHIPVGRPVRVTLTSEDVIHDFGIPAFRRKIDVIPGRYMNTWYLPTEVGDYHLFCNQYCGTSHAQMVGWIHVMKPEDYEDWLNGATSPSGVLRPSGGRAEGSLALQGRKLFLKLQCVTCHSADSHARAPVLENLYGHEVHLSDGRVVVADEAYLRKSILEPAADVVQGWQPIMPTFQGQLAYHAEDPVEDLTQEEALIQLIAYLKTLGPGQTPRRAEAFPPPIGAPTQPEERKNQR
jgi:cytochrome c oxidase subunit 2